MSVLWNFSSKLFYFMNLVAVLAGSDFILAMIVFRVPPMFTFIWNCSFEGLPNRPGDTFYLVGEELSVFIVS